MLTTAPDFELHRAFRRPDAVSSLPTYRATYRFRQVSAIWGFGEVGIEVASVESAGAGVSMTCSTRSRMTPGIVAANK
jgi:hypothetical protein